MILFRLWNINIEVIKRIYSDMKEQNLESPIYTETEQAVTLILKNNIEQRNKMTAKLTLDPRLDQADQGLDQADQGTFMVTQRS